MHNNSALLQTMFISELDNMLLTAGHDSAKLDLPLRLKIATGTELYSSISGKEVTTINEDIALCDRAGTISSILRGPDHKSRITSSTTEAVFTIYAPPGIEANYIQQGLRDLEKRVKSCSPSAKTELLQVYP